MLNAFRYPLVIAASLFACKGEAPTRPQPEPTTPAPAPTPKETQTLTSSDPAIAVDQVHLEHAGAGIARRAGPRSGDAVTPLSRLPVGTTIYAHRSIFPMAALGQAKPKACEVLVVARPADAKGGDRTKDETMGRYSLAP